MFQWIHYTHVRVGIEHFVVIVFTVCQLQLVEFKLFVDLSDLILFAFDLCLQHFYRFDVLWPGWSLFEQ
jgi:hypothetical protein